MKNTNLNESVPSVVVTDDREACSDVWIAILVQTHCERRVAEQLEGLSFMTFVAQQEELHRWSDRIKKVQRIVIPNIVFVKTQTKRLDELKRFSFVHGILRNPGVSQPAVIPEKQMEMLRFMLGQSDIPVSLDGTIRKFSLGKKVRVVRGSLRGLEGTVCRYNDGDAYVGIQIPLLGFAHIRISVNDIELLPCAK